LSTGRMRLAGTRHSRSAPVAVNACHNGTPRNSRSARTSWPGPQERGRRPTRVTSPVRQPASPQHPWGHRQHPHDLSRRTGPCRRLERAGRHLPPLPRSGAVGHRRGERDRCGSTVGRGQDRLLLRTRRPGQDAGTTLMSEVTAAVKTAGERHDEDQADNEDRDRERRQDLCGLRRGALRQTGRRSHAIQ
jgi:hypothetical protein